MSDLIIIGNSTPVVGVLESYTMRDFFEKISSNNDFSNFNYDPVKVHWEIYVLERGKWRKTKENDKTGNKVTYTFFEKSLTRDGIRLLVRKGDRIGRLDIKTLAGKPKIDHIQLLNKEGKDIKGNLSYGQTLKARVFCINMEHRKIDVTLWEDTVAGKGNNKTKDRNYIRTLPGIVKFGKADVNFLLTPSFPKIATSLGSEADKIHEYYVTAELNSQLTSSNNVNVNEPEAPVKPFEGRTTPKEPLKTSEHKPQPTKTSKVPVASEKAKPKINSVNITDLAGNKISGVFKQKQIKVWINSTELKGKKIRIRLYDEDLTSHDLLLTQDFTLESNLHVIVVSLDKIPRSLGDGFLEGNEQELFATVEVLQTNISEKSEVVNVDNTVFKQDKIEVTDKFMKVGGEKKKEKFKKVNEKAEEAIIYISNDIATPIILDKDGNIKSYPDFGEYNGMDEYIENNIIYSKKINIGGNLKSAFPTYKAYIYRGNTKGEAIKKLKQDLSYKSHENCEPTILEVARHTGGNNKNYLYGGPTPPNIIDKLYRLSYKIATNKKGKTSYRYRIVDDNQSNFPPIKNHNDEYKSGEMGLNNRSSISIDPWKSKDLVGCIGIRGANGENHISVNETISKQDKDNYKYIYHSLNNYLEEIIPELTGIYGRRGFSSTIGTVTVSESTYDHEVKVFVFVEPLPEINNCTCTKLEPKERLLYYESFGNKVINYVDNNSEVNKFKGLYMIAQRRQENGFNLKTIGNNPMNIKGSGDRGQIAIDTHETINGKYVSVPGEKFANFSSEDAGFKGYFDLLNSNYNDSYKSLFDQTKTIDDFTSGLEDTGKIGPYATGKAEGKLSGTEVYKAKVKKLFNGVKKDYLKLYECKLCNEKDIEKKKKIKEDLKLLNQLK